MQTHTKKHTYLVAFTCRRKKNSLEFFSLFLLLFLFDVVAVVVVVSFLCVIRFWSFNEVKLFIFFFYFLFFFFFLFHQNHHHHHRWLYKDEAYMKSLIHFTKARMHTSVHDYTHRKKQKYNCKSHSHMVHAHSCQIWQFIVIFTI